MALGQIGEASAAEALGRDLYHDNAEVRAAAAEALSHIGGGAQVESLDALKGDYYRRVRETAEQAYGRIASSGEPAK
jgi:HEAT repeat protein